MIGKRGQQRELFDVGNVFLLDLPAGNFYAQLANVSDRLFSDDQFRKLYDEKMGRPSVPPSLLALTLILQTRDGVSDEEAIARTAYDLRWAAVLRKPAGKQLCAKSTLCLFRAQLILNDEAATLFKTSIEEAKRAGLLKGPIRAAIDTKPIFGRGAVEDTFNLLASAVRQLAAALARSGGKSTDEFLNQNGLQRYAEPSLKGTAEIDWSDEQAKNAFLTGVVEDARRLLSLATGSNDRVQEAAALLKQILLQDVQEPPPPADENDRNEAPPGEHTLPHGASIKKGTAKGRVPSTTDPEMRHGRKSSSNRYDGHKGSVAADIESQIILAVDVLAGDAGDQTSALELVEQAEANTALPVSETVGDCAYGGGPTRETFEEAGRVLIAKVPKECAKGVYPKSAFRIDLANGTVTCPAGQTTSANTELDSGGRIFRFGAACANCPLASACTSSKQGRTISVHPHEARMQTARAYQQTPEGRQKLRSRVVVEHALARLGNLGIGQARYFGRKKTRYQLLMAATVANLRRTWNWMLARIATNAPVKAPLCVREPAIPTLMSQFRAIGSAIGRFTHRFRPLWRPQAANS